MQIQNSVGNIFGLEVSKFYTSPIPEEGRLALKTLYLQDKYLHMAAKDKGKEAFSFRFIRADSGPKAGIGERI
jgi:hypothetical protein